jgi:hypothetical protein
MRLCCVNSDLSVANLELLEAPPHLEISEWLSNPNIPGIVTGKRIRILERLTGVTDPVNGIVFYQEVQR